MLLAGAEAVSVLLPDQHWNMVEVQHTCVFAICCNVLTASLWSAWCGLGRHVGGKVAADAEGIPMPPQPARADNDSNSDLAPQSPPADSGSESESDSLWMRRLTFGKIKIKVEEEWGAGIGLLAANVTQTCCCTCAAHPQHGDWSMTTYLWHSDTGGTLWEGAVLMARWLRCGCC